MELTARQTGILQMLADGFTRDEITCQMRISLRTYSRDVAFVLAFVGASTVTEAAVTLTATGHLKLPDRHDRKIYSGAEVAGVLRRSTVSDPIGDAETHANNCFLALAVDFERGTTP